MTKKFPRLHEVIFKIQVLFVFYLGLKSWKRRRRFILQANLYKGEKIHIVTHSLKISRHRWLENMARILSTPRSHNALVTYRICFQVISVTIQRPCLFCRQLGRVVSKLKKFSSSNEKKKLFEVKKFASVGTWMGHVSSYAS